MTRTPLSCSLLLLASVLLPVGCKRSAPAPVPTTVVVDEAGVPNTPSAAIPDASTASAGDTMEDAMRADACSAEVASPLPAGPSDQANAALPVLKKRVTDFTGLLTPECVADLNDRLKALETDTGAQVVVLLVNDTHGMDIEGYANAVYHGSKLGRQGVDDGALVVASIGERRARIEVGYGLEGILPDAVAGDMLRDDLKPNFAAKRYNAGISAVVEDLSKRVRLGGTAPVGKKHDSSGVWVFVALLVLSVATGSIAEALRLRWPLRLLLIPAAVDLIVLMLTLLNLTIGYRLMIAMVPISLIVSLLGIPLVRSTGKVLQWAGSCVMTSLLIAAIAASINRANGHGFHVPSGWDFAAGAIGTMLGSILFLLSQILPGSRRSRSSSHDWDDRPSSSSSSSSSDDSSSSSSSSDSGSFSGGGGDSGGGGASTSW